MLVSNGIMAQYQFDPLRDPIMVKQYMLIVLGNKTVENSLLYQNPYWPIEPDMPAENKILTYSLKGHFSK